MCDHAPMRVIFTLALSISVLTGCGTASGADAGLDSGSTDALSADATRVDGATDLGTSVDAATDLGTSMEAGAGTYSKPR